LREARHAAWTPCERKCASQIASFDICNFGRGREVEMSHAIIVFSFWVGMNQMDQSGGIASAGTAGKGIAKARAFWGRRFEALGRVDDLTGSTRFTAQRGLRCATTCDFILINMGVHDV
jgi:hypothetical protein